MHLYLAENQINAVTSQPIPSNMSSFRNKADKKIRKIQNHNEIRTT